MAVLIRNPSLEISPLPYPLRGVLKGGQAIILTVAYADLVSACPTIIKAYHVENLGEDYDGENHDLNYGLLWPTSGAVGDILIRGATGWDRLPRDSDGKVLTLVSGSPAWEDSSGGSSGTTRTLTSASSTTFTPSQFPCGLTIRGYAKGGTGSWKGLIQSHVDLVGSTYSVSSLDMTAGLAATVTINSATGVVTVTFSEAVTGRLLINEI